MGAGKANSYSKKNQCSVRENWTQIISRSVSSLYMSSEPVSTTQAPLANGPSTGGGGLALVRGQPAGDEPGESLHPPGAHRPGAGPPSEPAAALRGDG